MLYTHVLCPSRILQIVRLSTAVLFPNGNLGPSPIIPTEAEQVEIRATLLRRLAAITSGSSSATSNQLDDTLDSSRNPQAILCRSLLGPTAKTQREVLAQAVDGLGDKHCNMHLILFILDAIVLRMFPEIGVPIVGTSTEAVDERFGGPTELSRSVSAATGSSNTQITPPGSVNPVAGFSME